MNEFYRRPDTWRSCTSGCEVRKSEKSIERPTIVTPPPMPIVPPIQEPVPLPTPMPIIPPVAPPVAIAPTPLPTFPQVVTEPNSFEPPEVVFPVIPPIVAPVIPLIEPVSPQFAQQTFEQQMFGRVATQGSNLNLREHPSTSATVLARIPNGTTITILHRLPGWDYIMHNGMQGYVASEWVRI